MKAINSIFIIMFTLSLGMRLNAQNSEIPNISLKDLNGKSYNISSKNSDKPIVISFWATWCSSCIKELEAINEVYKEWKKETGVELIAISIDDIKTSKRVKPMVSGKKWDYTILLDENQDFKRRMNVSHPPYTVIVSKGKIVYKHTGYVPGDEKKLYEEIKKYAK